MQKTGLYKQEDVDIMKNHLNVISKVSDIWSGGKLEIVESCKTFLIPMFRGPNSTSWLEDKEVQK